MSKYRLNTKGEEITGNWETPKKTKYAIKTESTNTILRINHLNIEDMGEYSLQATNQDKFDMLNFTLDVLGIFIFNNRREKLFIIFIVFY